jgi:signal transduction histidine kinase
MRAHAPQQEIDFRRLFEGAPGLYLVLGPDLTILGASDGYLRATMTDREAIVGRHLFDVFPDNPDDPEASGVANLRDSLERVRRDRVPDAMALQKYDVRQPGGAFEARWWSPLNVPLLDDDGTLRYIIHRVEDVTDFILLKASESAMEQQAEELRQRSARMEVEIVRRSQELHRANRELKAANAAKDDLLSRTSHELRTPLTAILGFAELLGMEELTPNQADWVRQITRAGNHLGSLISDVLDISRVTAGSVSMSIEPISTVELLQEVAQLVGPIASARGVRLRVSAAKRHRYAAADRQRLKQVVLNLVSNAVKYNQAEGTVDLRVVDAGAECVRFEVQDSGWGISPEDLEKVFNPFERLRAARAGVEGTGLGLAVSRSLVEAMSGSIGVTSEPGRGSTFWVELPRAEPAAVDMPGEQEAAVLSRAYPGPRTVLYIEDTVANVRLVEGILARRPSTTLLPAALGSLGLELARTRPDLVLLDLHLPDMDGIEILRRLRRDPATRHIPVVALSADATDRQTRRTLGAGADAYLTKPISVRRLLEILDQFLGESPPA